MLAVEFEQIYWQIHACEQITGLLFRTDTDSAPKYCNEKHKSRQSGNANRPIGTGRVWSMFLGGMSQGITPTRIQVPVFFLTRLYANRSIGVFGAFFLAFPGGAITFPKKKLDIEPH